MGHPTAPQTWAKVSTFDLKVVQRFIQKNLQERFFSRVFDNKTFNNDVFSKVLRTFSAMFQTIQCQKQQIANKKSQLTIIFSVFFVKFQQFSFKSTKPDNQNLKNYFQRFLRKTFENDYFLRFFIIKPSPTNIFRLLTKD